MATINSTVTVLSPKSVPKPIESGTSVRSFYESYCFSPISNVKSFGRCRRRWRLAKLVTAAGLTEIEPDLNEDPVDRYDINSVKSGKFLAPSSFSLELPTPVLFSEDFKYSYYDGAHTYYEGEVEKGTFWGAIADDIAAVEPPTGFQGFISWMFLPVVAAGMYFDVPGEYLFIGAAIFTVVFCIIEMDKPDQPHNFEPQIYNMERGARDKLLSDYNSMSIWDFNEKYGDIWDFTVKKDDITER